MALPSTARIYDYLLGGHENYKVDREAAKNMVAAVPDSPTAVRSNRAFLYRAVRYLVGEAGITQFIDIGSGLPTQLNVHQVAHSMRPDTHVVYVDYDPLVNAFGNALLSTTDTVSFARRDLRLPGEVLGDPQVRKLIDFDQPVAVLLIAMLQFIDEDEDPNGIVAQLVDALPSAATSPYPTSWTTRAPAPSPKSSSAPTPTPGHPGPPTGSGASSTGSNSSSPA